MAEKITFSFGKNWQDFLNTITDEKLQIARNSIIEFTGIDDFTDKEIIDIGSGSGIFSYSIHELNAKKVVSLDIDPFSVDCTKHMWLKAGSPISWSVHEDSIIREDVVAGLGTFDLVYSWGVLHHTGKMWEAISNAANLVREDGYLYIAIYNRVTGIFGSEFWLSVKKLHNRYPFLGRYILEPGYILSFYLTSIIKGRNPLKLINDYKVKRGMNWRRDVTDWIGGYPYEYATIEEIFKFMKSNHPDLELINIKSTNGLGNNWFLFKRKSNE